MGPGTGKGNWKTRPRSDQSEGVGVVRPLRRVCKHIPKLKGNMAEIGEETDRQSDSSRSCLPGHGHWGHHYHQRPPVGELSSYSGIGFAKHPLWPLIWGIHGVPLRPNLGERGTLGTCKGGKQRSRPPQCSTGWWLRLHLGSEGPSHRWWSCWFSDCHGPRIRHLPSPHGDPWLPGTQSLPRWTHLKIIPMATCT